MPQERSIPVSPRHTVRLAKEYLPLIDRAPRQDYVVRTLTRREAGGMPLISAELIIAGEATRKEYRLAAAYPLHFRKTYFPGRFHGDPKREFDGQTRAAKLLGLPPPIGHTPQTIRTCFIPGRPYPHLSPFGREPDEANLAPAREIPPAAAAGLWKMAEEAFRLVTALHEGGMVHGDLELHNIIVCPSPLESLLIDFENASWRTEAKIAGAGVWEKRRMADLDPLLREAIFLQSALGRQKGAFADMAWREMDRLFKAPERFRREIGGNESLTDEAPPH